MTKPLVSVVIPVYNMEEFLEETLTLSCLLIIRTLRLL